MHGHVARSRHQPRASARRSTAARPQDAKAIRVAHAKRESSWDSRGGTGNRARLDPSGQFDDYQTFRKDGNPHDLLEQFTARKDALQVVVAIGDTAQDDTAVRRSRQA